MNSNSMPQLKPRPRPRLKPKDISYLCGLTTEPLLFETLGNCFDRIADTFPDREAVVVCHQSIRWTFKQYQKAIDALAA
ncbi:MAG: hypothetical protein MJK04_33380, partial [Psychrosphaera sp.]|nr:hypothetical protein [Psychrosphaera sp.]